MKPPTKPGTLVTRVQVRAILDNAARERGSSVSKQRARILEDHEDFPAPIDAPEDGQGRPGPIWVRHQIEGYARNRSVAGGRPAAIAASENH